MFEKPAAILSLQQPDRFDIFAAKIFPTRQRTNDDFRRQAPTVEIPYEFFAHPLDSFSALM
jgi:hypothetical protein